IGTAALGKAPSGRQVSRSWRWPGHPHGAARPSLDPTARHRSFLSGYLGGKGITMRDLDEALARLARRDKLQKRHTSGESDRLQNAVDDVTDTLRRLVERHRGLSVVARIEADDASTEIRVARDGGMVRVDRKDILSGPVRPPVNRHHSAADDPLFGPSPLTEPRFTDTH